MAEFHTRLRGDLPNVFGRPFADRESQICALVVEGKSNKQIAMDLGLAYGSVKQRLHTMFRKMGVSDRQSMKLRAIKEAEQRMIEAEAR